MFLRNVAYVLINLVIILPFPLSLVTNWRTGVAAWLGISLLTMVIIAIATTVEMIQRRRSKWWNGDGNY